MQYEKVLAQVDNLVCVEMYNTFYINKHKCVAITNGGRINKFSTHRGPKNLSINVTFTG